MSRIALVTGASRGIGRQIARTLAHHNNRVALTFNTRADLAAEVVDELQSTGHTAMAVQMAAEDRSSIKHALAEVRQRWGGVEILVNNAAIAQEKPFLEITDQDWDRILAVNLRAPFACVQEVLPDMIDAGWGRIINISSIGGQWGGSNQVHYAASKAALINFTRSLAKLYSHAGITSNAVAIGLVETAMTARELASKEGQQKANNIPMGRIGDMREIADTVAFLASDAASYITGQTVNLNGGMYFG